MCPPLASLTDQAGGDRGDDLTRRPCVTEEGVEALALLPVCDRNGPAPPLGDALPKGAGMLEHFSVFKAPSAFITLGQRPSTNIL